MATGWRPAGDWQQPDRHEQH